MVENADPMKLIATTPDGTSTRNDELMFTRRLYVYLESEPSEQLRARITLMLWRSSMLRRLTAGASFLVVLVLLSRPTAAERTRRWDAPYNPTAMQWLAMSMQAGFGGQNCLDQPNCIEVTFAPAPGSVALGILFSDRARSVVTRQRLDQMKKLALATAEGMGYPPPELFIGTVDEFLAKYRAKTAPGGTAPRR